MPTHISRFFKTRALAWLLAAVATALLAIALVSRRGQPRTPREWFNVALKKGVYGEEYQAAAFLSKREFLSMALRELQRRESRLSREYRLLFPMLPNLIVRALPSPVPAQTRYITAFATVEMLILADSETLAFLSQQQATLEQMLRSEYLEVSQSAALILFAIRTGEPRVLTHAACDYLRHEDFLVRLSAAFRCVVPGQNPKPSADILRLGLPILNEVMTNTAQIDALFGPAAAGWRRGASARIQSFSSDSSATSP
jgi:hypothetical protein